MLTLRVAGLEETHAVASAVADLARVGDIVVLSGEMGVGKTAFAQGFGRALGVSEPITSPTFTLVHSYPTAGRLTLHHADLYRLDRTVDIEELALPELAEFHGVVLVEWGDVAAAALGDHLAVHLLHDDDDAHDDDADDDAGLDGPGGDDRRGVDQLDAAFGDNGRRQIELHASGPAWAGRWTRLATALEQYRC